MVATKPVDFRKGMEGLALLVREHIKADPFSGAVYVFRAKRADRIKLIFWDGTGLCLFAKRLEEGVFRWPKIEDGVMRLSAAELSTGIQTATSTSYCPGPTALKLSKPWRENDAYDKGINAHCAAFVVIEVQALNALRKIADRVRCYPSRRTGVD